MARAGRAPSPRSTAILLAALALSMTLTRVASHEDQQMPMCQRGSDGIVKITAKLVDQFVRLDILRVEPKDVIEALIRILMGDNPECEARFATLQQLKRLALALNFTSLTPYNLLSLARSGEIERLQELTHHGSNSPQLAQDYSEALQADPGNHLLRLDFGRLRVLDGSQEEFEDGTRHILAAIGGLEAGPGGKQASDPARLDLAVAYQSAGDHRSALKHFADLISTDVSRLVVWHLASKSFQAASFQNPNNTFLARDSLRARLVLSRMPPTSIEIEPTGKVLASPQISRSTLSDSMRDISSKYSIRAQPNKLQDRAPLMREILSKYSAARARWRQEDDNMVRRRLLVYTPGPEGWGNRMLVLASIVLMAVQTERELVLDWNGPVPLDQVFDDSFFALFWDDPGPKPWGQIQRICAGEGRRWDLSDPEVTCGGKKNVDHCACGKAARKGAENVHWLYHHGSSTLVLQNPIPFFGAERDLLRADRRFSWGSRRLPTSQGGPDVIWYKGLGSFILAQARLSSYNWAWEACGVPHGEQVPVAGCIFSEVIKPGPLVQAEIDEMKQTASRYGTAMVGLAMRRGNRAKSGGASVSDGQQKDSYSYLQRSGEEALLACALNVVSNRASSGQNVSVFLATDDPDFVVDIRTVLGAKVPVIMFEKGQSVWLSMLVDWFMLGSTDDAVLTDGSTFGLTAFSQSHVNGPWPISVRQGDMKCHRRQQQTEFVPQWVYSLPVV